MEKDLMEELLSLLQEISNNYKFDDKDKSAYYQKLKEIYSDDKFRHSYAVLSRFSEQELTPDSRDELVGYLDSILAYADENIPSDEKIIKRIGKLADHLELECIRLQRVEQIKIISNNIKLEKEQTELIVKDNLSKFKQQNDDIKNMNTQMVSVLGIFSAVVIAFFGGMSYFASVFSSLNEIPIYKALVAASVLGLVIFNTIYILLKFILLVLRANTLKSKLKYGNILVWVVNGVLILLIVVSIIMWYNVDYKNNSNSDKNNTSNTVVINND